MEKIKNILNTVVKNITTNQGTNDAGLKDLWCRSVKKKVAEHTKPCYLKKGKLCVNVENPAWLFEMRNNQSPILERLKKTSKNKIKSIFFRVGDVNDNSE